MKFAEPKPDPAESAPAEGVADDRLLRVSRRPDGFHWVALDGRQEFGPFDTLEAALADMEDADDSVPEEGESLVDAEHELGIADWLDPDTGALAEETTVRIEDH